MFTRGDKKKKIRAKEKLLAWFKKEETKNKNEEKKKTELSRLKPHYYLISIKQN